MKNLAHIPEEKLEDLPSKDKRVHDWDDRYYNRHEYPWKRVSSWLKGNVGKPWNEVISKFVKLPWVPTKRRTFSQLVEYHVETLTYMKGSKVWYFHRWTWHQTPQAIDKESGEILYVHPVTGLLCLKKRKPYTRTKHPETYRILGPYHQLCKQDGIWYEAWCDTEMAKRFKVNSDKPLLNVTKEKLKAPTGFIVIDFSASSLVKVHKRQLNHKELQQLGLKNETKSV